MTKGTIIEMSQLQNISGTVYKVRQDNIKGILTLQPSKQALDQFLTSNGFTDATIQLISHDYWIEARSKKYDTLQAILLKLPRDIPQLKTDLKAYARNCKIVKVEQ